MAGVISRVLAGTIWGVSIERWLDAFMDIENSDIYSNHEEFDGTTSDNNSSQTENLNQEIKEQIQSNPNENTDKIEEDAVSEDSIVMGITGKIGKFAPIPMDKLIPTPKEWNQFTPISKNRKMLMADSIHRIGLQNPIIVRRIGQEEKYQILSGNTRYEIYNILYNSTFPA